MWEPDLSGGQHKHRTAQDWSIEVKLVSECQILGKAELWAPESSIDARLHCNVHCVLASEPSNDPQFRFKLEADEHEAHWNWSEVSLLVPQWTNKLTMYSKHSKSYCVNFCGLTESFKWPVQWVNYALSQPDVFHGVTIMESLKGELSVSVLPL